MRFSNNAGLLAGRTRFLLQVKLYDRNVDLAHLDQKGRSQLQAGLEAAVRGAP